MTKAGLFYHNITHLLKNKNVHIMVNYSCSAIPQVEGKINRYTAHDVKRADLSRKFHKIAGQPIKQILHVGNNNILQNLPNFRWDIGMAEAQCDTFSMQNSPAQDSECGTFYGIKCPQGNPLQIQESHPMLWPRDNQWHLLHEHHTPTHHVCHRKYDSKSKNKEHWRWD